MDEGQNGLKQLAERHGVSLDAVRHLIRALEDGNGTMAQFNHPDLGGFGQWSTGGMTMIGDMFNTDLKARVAALCTDLAHALPSGGWSTGASPSDVPSSPSHWWPGDLGRPSSTGAQNGMRYAYFPEMRRLAVEADGAVSLYDTEGHDISGVSQQQGSGPSLRFSGRNGPIDLDGLKRVDGPLRPMGSPDGAHPAQPRPFEPEPLTPTRRPDGKAEAISGGEDILAILEGLAVLHERGVLTDTEFSTKKAELLARL